MNTFVARFAALSALTSLAVLPAIAACGSSTTPPTNAGQIGRSAAAIQVMVPSAKATPGSVQRITVTVSGAGISPAISADLVAGANGYEGTVTNIPVGADRGFHVQATDSVGTVLLTGDATAVAITPGDTAVVTLVLEDATAPVPFQNTAPQITALSASGSTATPGEAISLVVSATDVDGDALTYAWTSTAGSFDDATAATPVWTAPAGAFSSSTLSVVVTDTHGATDGISLTIAAAAGDAGAASGSATVLASVNHWPAVSNVLSTPTRLGVGDVAKLDVTAHDVEADALSFAWTSTCAGTFDAAGAQRPAFTLAALAPSGSCAFTVTVTDARGGHGVGTLVIHTGDPGPVTTGDGGTDAGVDADAATFCTPNAATCSGTTLTVCAADGSATTTSDCPLGCGAAACVHLLPSNLSADTCATPGATDLAATGATTIDTSTGCDQVVVQGAGAPEICVRKYRTVSSVGTLTVTGPRALALVATESMSLAGGIEGGGKLDVSGPGADDALGTATHGGGAGHATAGAPSGIMGGDTTTGPGGASYGDATGVPLLGGARGGRGDGQNAQLGLGGGGGGALQLVSCGTFTFPNNGSSFIHAWGGGGRGGEAHSRLSAGGGGGGGSGGTVLIEAAHIVVAAQTGPHPIVQAWGAPGGGGGGGGLTGSSIPGQDATGISGGQGGASAGNGGDSPIVSGSATAGGNGTLLAQPAPEQSYATGAGGGGGANGVIRFNSLAGASLDLSQITIYPTPTVGTAQTR